MADGVAQESAADGKSPLAQMELLAPAGDAEALRAALEAGASAVYFGLTVLHARRGARSFRQDEFAGAVEIAHGHGARVCLTLNIDLTDRELGQAARILELARQSRVDAVLMRDPALLALKPCYPELEFHFSTQTCMASSADVAAAGKLGAVRVVLARELTLSEIAAASSVPGVQTEVFAQGALCFSVSGRCLLSSWVGGRSGNRGTCTSPCRVPWSGGQGVTETPLSMRDLTTVHRLRELREAGVSALKIEGRLKTAAWVARAVSLYRRALAGEDNHVLLEEAADLGAYTGRLLTCDYLDGKRDDLTALALGRSPGAVSADRSETPPVPDAPQADEGAYDLTITVGDRGIVCRCECNGRTVEWSMPRTVVHRQLKATSIADLFDRLASQPTLGCRLGKRHTNDEQFLLVPRACNALMDRVAAAIRQSRKQRDDEQVRIELPEAVRKLCQRCQPFAGNDLSLGEKPDRVRLEAGDVAPFMRRLRASGIADARPGAVIVEGLTSSSLDKVVTACAEVPLIVALPSVFFEQDIGGIRELLIACACAGLTVEVNNWGGWFLAQQSQAPMEAGWGLGVLNSLACRALADIGMRCVTLSIEADRKQLEEVTSHCPAPCSLVVFGRPPLMITRVQLPREQYLGKTITDRRGTRMIGRVERGLWVFRPAEPFDLRRTHNPRIRVRHLVVDLVGSSDPAGEWLKGPPDGARQHRFNYDRSLA